MECRTCEPLIQLQKINLNNWLTVFFPTWRRRGLPARIAAEAFFAKAKASIGGGTLAPRDSPDVWRTAAPARAGGPTQPAPPPSRCLRRRGQAWAAALWPRGTAPTSADRHSRRALADS